MPSPVHVYRGNRTETLASALAGLLETNVGGPFESETIVVQGRGMAAWLSHRLAEEHGVAANHEFSFPRDYVTRALHAVLGADALPAGVPSEDQLLFALLGELPPLLARPELATLAHYLRDDANGIRLFELADRIATRFDQYVLYRPDLVLAWERGEDGDIPAAQTWQPILFRAVRARRAAGHVAGLEEAFRERLASGTVPSGLPRRVALFGISTLPPLFVRVIGRLSAFVETHLFLFSPSPTEWWHAVPRNGAEPSPSTRESPLIASLGALGAEFHAVLEAELGREGVPVVTHDLHAPPEALTAPGAPRALGRIQAEIYDRAALPRGPRPVLGDADGTISIHSCHGPMREVEVLHDQLLHLLTSEGSELAPQDIVVMMPDVDGYAPFVEAVFDRAPRHLSIPYRISDRSVRVDCPAIDAFHRVLSLVGRRATAGEVLDLLNLDVVQRRVGIDPQDLDQITTWVVESGIRWGIDERHREAQQQPGERDGTWRFGLDRLLLGYAMPTSGRAMFAGVLPFDEVEGKGAALVGQLADLTERLFAELVELEAARPLPEWRARLERMAARLIVNDGTTGWQHVKIEEALASLEADATESGFSGPLDLAIVRRLLDRRLDTAYPERGFLTRGVTFCAMVPMRTLPFDVICLLGMNDGAFPRGARSPDFDLIARGRPRPGDRDRRKDDRHLFLEALMAARKHLLVTYTGQSIQDGSTLPPSVVVSELVDRVLSAFDPSVPADTESARRDRVAGCLIVRHPLQGFSRRYFDGTDSRLFSYAETYEAGARHLTPDRIAAPRLFTELLPPTVEEDGPLALDELVRFFEDPILYLLSRRLGLYLKDDETDVPDREPLELDPLEKYRLGDDLLRLSGALGPPPDTIRLLRGAGALPPAELGSAAYDETAEIVRSILDKAAPHALGTPRTVSVDLRLPNGTRLVGRVPDLHDGGLCRASFSRVRAKHQIALFLRHLAVSLTGPKSPTSALVGRAKIKGVLGYSFRSVPNAAALLEEYVGLYREGLRGPLRFTADSGLAYLENLKDGDAPALEKARTAHRGERDGKLSPHLSRVFGDSQPDFSGVTAAVGDFRALSRSICAPLLAARSKL